MSSSGGVTGRKKRADAGTPRLTARDSALLLWVGEQRAVPYDLLARQLMGDRPVSQNAVANMTYRWRRLGLAVTGQPIPGPTWVWLSRRGARQVLGWDVGDYMPTGATAPHDRAVAAVRAHIGYRPGVDGWISERRWRHAIEGYRSAESRVRHVPDAVFTAADGRNVAVEVELTGKGPARTAEILKVALGAGSTYSWPEDVKWSRIQYWCSDNAINDVRRAVEMLEADTHWTQQPGEWRGRVRVESINGVPLWR